ncbi:MAG: baseplate J/gp47 family protein [Kluyvera sp.]|uniref:baseplate J/gp47 family protein n=1 Tax=Kluyvera sp. TaxID=1538228 RepID=UPI003A8C12F6
MSERFPQIPAPVIISPDYEGTLKRVKSEYQGLTGHYPDTNDPETFLLEQVAYEREELVDDINETAKQNLLGYATDGNLDNLGALVETLRLDASAATASATLTLVSGHPDFVLATGYQVMAKDGITLFATTADIPITTAMNSVDTILTATEVGIAANGFLPGEIATPVTQNNYVSTATNTTTSQGGAEVENDDKYARRIYLAPSRFSVAGPYDAYKYFARSASPAISDVAVWSPEPNDIYISAVLDNGVVPDAAIKQAMLDICSDKRTRPLGDRVSAIDSVGVTASGVINVQIYKASEALEASIKQTASNRVAALTGQWCGQLGRDIVPEALTSIVQNIGGVYRATTDIEYQQLDTNQFPLVTITDIVTSIVDEVEA